MNKVRAIIAFMVLSLTVVSCGGGMSASGGTGGTGIMARGAVTQTSGNSVTVNTVTYTTTAAPSVRTGMVVTVSGEVYADRVSGAADTITYTRTLIGRMLTAGGSAAGGFTVYGQNVTYHLPVSFESLDGTVFTFSGLPGEVVPTWLADHVAVEASGFVLADGTVEASYVKQLASDSLIPGDQMEFLGLVTSVDAASPPVWIRVNGMEVTLPAGYDPVAEPIVVGDYAHVHAQVPASDSAAGVTATDIDIVDMDLGGAEGDEGEIEGIVSNLAADKSSLTVAGQEVQITDATVWDEGASRDALANNMHIEVEGHFTAGLFYADEIEFE